MKANKFIATFFLHLGLILLISCKTNISLIEEVPTPSSDQETNFSLSNIDPIQLEVGQNFLLIIQNYIHAQENLISEINFLCKYDLVIDNAVSSPLDCNSISGLSFSESNGQISWTPILSEVGTYEFNIIATYSSHTTSTIFNIQVSPQSPSYNTEEVVLIGSIDNYYYLSTDSGETFTKRTDANAIRISIGKHHHISDDRQTIIIGMYTASTANPSIHVTNDKGSTWSIVSLPGITDASTYIPSLNGTGQYILIAAWANGGTFFSTNNGASFTKIAANSRVASALSDDGKYAVALNWAGDRIVSNDFLSTFTNVGAAGYQAGVDIFMSDSGEYTLIGDKFLGMLLLSNYGLTETTIFNPTTSYTPVSMNSDGSLMAGVNEDNRDLWWSDNLGVTWNQLSIPGSSTNIVAILEIPDSSIHSDKIFVVNSTDFPNNLYKINAAKNGFDLVYSFPTNIVRFIGTEDLLFVTLADGSLYRAQLSDSSSFTLLRTFTDLNIEMNYLDAK
ncbi:MAG: putative Ig domain-containing protein [Halobacteriovoraceae bacterium]|nr:putative Ig domain-containing protein [Halobacteriovoraceae bacterium]MCB9094001.1 putative Ig domain-containing protein [Halobacteriovoraceae bacterium]